MQVEAIPLTAGLGRGTVLPVLRVNEALLLLVVGGVLLARLPRRRPLVFSGLDVAVVAFCVAWLLIDPREPAGEARHSGTAERCEGTAASCAK